MSRTIRTILVLVLVLALALLLAFAGVDGRSERSPAAEAQRVIPIGDGLRLVVDALKDGEVVGHLEARVNGAWLGVTLRDPNARFVMPAR